MIVFGRYLYDSLDAHFCGNTDVIFKNKSFAAVNTATVASKMTIVAVN